MTKTDFQYVNEIAERAMGLPWRDMPTKLDMLMDISAAHEAIPLRLDALLCADIVNFTHDVVGIRRHLNRETLQIEDGFCPRFARR